MENVPSFALRQSDLSYFTKEIATIYGVSFTIALFVVFTTSEIVNRRRIASTQAGLEEFNLDVRPDLNAEHQNPVPWCCFSNSYGRKARNTCPLPQLMEIVWGGNFRTWDHSHETGVRWPTIATITPSMSAQVPWLKKSIRDSQMPG